MNIMKWVGWIWYAVCVAVAYQTVPSVFISLVVGFVLWVFTLFVIFVALLIFTEGLELIQEHFFK